MIKIGSTIDDRYEILKEIDRGGMSIVYLAADNRLKKSVVLKDIRKNNKIDNNVLLDCLKAEADLLTALDHPNLPKIYDIIEGDGHIYVVMDYIEGESLKKKLDREKKCLCKDVVDFGIQISDVLGYLHSRKPDPIIYRDMKPHNLMLTPEGKIKLIDFGIAIKADSDDGKPNFGTNTYAAPEQLSDGKTDERTDIYSLGVTLYQLVTGAIFKDNKELKSIRVLDSGFPEGLEYIINKCLKKNPNDRYQNCEELLYDLENMEKLTKDYRKKQIKKMSLFIVSFLLLITSSVICFIGYDGIRTNRLNNYKAILNEASIYVVDGNNSKAIETLNRAITEVDSSASEAYIELLDLYMDMGETETGLAKIEGYINDKYGNVHKNDEVLFKVAMTYLNNKNYPIALKYFSLIDDDEIPEAKYYITISDSMSNMSINYSEFEKELLEFEKFVDSQSNDDRKLSNYNSLASVYSSYKGQISNANEKVIDIVNKGYETLEKIDDKELKLKYEVEYCQKLAQAYHSKGSNESNEETAEGYFDNAVNLYEELLDLEVRNAEDIIIKIGDIHGEMKEYDLAIENYNKAISKSSGSIKAYCKLINVLIDMEQNKGEAEKNYSLAKEKYNIVSQIQGANDNEDFKRLKRRMLNLEIL